MRCGLRHQIQVAALTTTTARRAADSSQDCLPEPPKLTLHARSAHIAVQHLRCHRVFYATLLRQLSRLAGGSECAWQRPAVEGYRVI
jgi:hypothetical protein